MLNKVFMTECTWWSESPRYLYFQNRKLKKKCVISHLDFQNRKICNPKKIPRRLLAEYEEEQARLERLSEKVDKLPEIQFWGCFFACLHKIILQCMVCGCGNLATLTLALVMFFCTHLLLESDLRA